MRNNRKRAAKETACPQQQTDTDHFGTGKSDGIRQSFKTLSWPVEWFGTFPIRKVTAENVEKRLDALLEVDGNGDDNDGEQSPNGTTTVPQRHRRKAFLRISETAVEVVDTDDEGQKTPSLLLSHTLRKVCCAVCRVRTAQLAYITREQHSHHGHHVPGRKLCHAFRVGTSLHAQLIQTALAEAFRRQQQQKRDDSEPNCPLGVRQNGTSNDNDHEGTMLMAWHPPDSLSAAISSHRVNFESIGALPEVNDGTRENAALITPRRRGTPSPFSSQMRFSSSSLLQRIFGGGSATPKKIVASTACSPAKKMVTPNSIGFRFRRPRWPLPTFRSSVVSATALTERNSATDQQLHAHVPPPQPLRWHHSAPATTAAAMEFAAAECEKQNESEMSRHNAKKEEQLLYDDRIKEWIYPMDVGTMAEELDKLAYFCRPQEKDIAMAHLRTMPVGHFALRLSGTRRRCLALSIRVEKDEKSPKGIAHYLVLRNEHGFRIKGSKRYFQSLPMLITHHSVITDQLPCRLLLSDWRWTRDEIPRRRQSSGGSTLAVLRAMDEANGNGGFTTTPQNKMPNDAAIRWRKDALSAMTRRQNGAYGRTTTNSSTLISSQSSTVLSA